jgi:GAF domain-containing protein
MYVLPGRTRDDRIIGEQAALRRVATLVAGAASPEQVFAAVTEEGGRLLDAHHAALSLYGPDGAARVVAVWSSTGAAFPVGTRASLGGRNAHTLVFETGRAARIDDYAGASGPAADIARGVGTCSAVGVPVSVEGRLWGVMVVASTQEEPLPAGTEARLAGFTELAATAIANAQARVELRGFADEQAALRRVATLVARGAPPPEVFTAVAEEVGRVLEVDFTFLSRYDPDGSATIAGAWTRTGTARALSVGSRWSLGGRNLHTMVFQTGRPVRIDDYSGVSGPVAEAAREIGFRSAAGVPVSVEGRLWGAMFVASTREQPLPAGTEARLAGFTELAATAIANTQARVELRRFAEEQAALRRVATLVARAAPPEEVLAAVAEEAGRLLGAHHATLSRYGPDGAARVVASWSSTGAAFPVGTQWGIGGRNLHTLVFQTGRAVRMDDYAGASGPAARARELGVRASVGVPVSAGGRLWGVMIVGSHVEPPPAGTEARLAGFTELAATAIANTQARMELRGFAGEQAALRRVATLVARAAPPAEVLAAVAEEAGWLLGAHQATMGRYGPDGATRVVATWSSTGAAFPVGTQWGIGGQNLHTLVFQTGRAVRIDDYAGASGPVAEAARELGTRSGAGVPVSAGGRLWGVMGVGFTREEPLPAGTEAQLAGFTELAATAIANAEGQAALAASRARIVATADATRRRIERDLHDGAQQHLVSLALQVRAAQAAAPPGAGVPVQQLDGVAAGLTGVLEELREIACGLHPAILAERGLRPALKALARRSAVPVRLDVQAEGRLPEPVEIAAYYVVAEALTNTAKHAHATLADVQVAAGDGVLHVRVRDDGRGGADFGGSGLTGLRDRAEAIGGRLALHSPPGTGTTLEITLPLGDPTGPGLPPAAAGRTDEADRGHAADPGPPGPPGPAREM